MRTAQEVVEIISILKDAWENPIEFLLVLVVFLCVSGLILLGKGIIWSVPKTIKGIAWWSEMERGRFHIAEFVVIASLIGFGISYITSWLGAFLAIGASLFFVRIELLKPETAMVFAALTCAILDGMIYYWSGRAIRGKRHAGIAAICATALACAFGLVVTFIQGTDHLTPPMWIISILAIPIYPLLAWRETEAYPEYETFSEWVRRKFGK